MSLIKKGDSFYFIVNILDLENSYVFFGYNTENCVRTSIKSTLTNVTDNKTFYLTKECRAEMIGQYPFTHPSKSELCIVVEDKNCKYLIRDNPVFKENDFDSHHYGIHSLKEKKDEVILNKTNYDLLDYKSVLKRLNNRTLENVYCKIDYTFQNKSYSVFSKVEYLNFAGSEVNNRTLDTNYLQPIMGYVPFEKNGKIYIAYAVRYISPKLEGNLEFRLRANTKLSNFYYGDYGLKVRLKFLLLNFLKIKASEFYERISINESEYSFYIKK